MESSHAVTEHLYFSELHSEESTLFAFGIVLNVRCVVPSVAAFSQTVRSLGIISHSGRFAKKRDGIVLVMGVP